MNIKKLLIQSGNKEVEAIETWTVRWNSKKQNGYDYFPEVEVFKSEKDACEFKQAIDAAFNLLRYKDGFMCGNDLTKCVIEKNK
jgi:hypothetical protein